MLIDILKSIFQRDLARLKTEISLYRDEEKLWCIAESIANSGGNLCLHLMGNLNTYISAGIGGFNYIRSRELEFSLKNIPKKELLKRIEDTIITVGESLDKLREEDLENEYPMLVFDKKTSTGYLLVHLATHLTYHLGQVNYHRRLLDV